jgi:soluble lytic murein transglycosylase
VRAIEILYAIGEHDLIASGLAELGERSMDIATLAAIGDVAAHQKDARAMVLLGRAALARGLPFEHFAFPTVGVPEHRAIGLVLSRGSSMPSRVRKAPLIRALFQVQVP